MYYRNPDYFDDERLSKMAGGEPDSKPVTLPSRLLLSIGLSACFGYLFGSRHWPLGQFALATSTA